MFPGGFYGSQANGLLDEVRIWNVARTQAQIAANKDEELTGPQTGLVGYWPMNEGTGLMLHDVSGSGRDVDLTSAGYTSASWTNGRYSVASIIGNYRYAFNGKEKDQDIGEDDYDYGMRIHDARLGRFLSIDPLTKSFPELSTYQYASNSPIKYIDLDGREALDPATPTGIIVRTIVEDNVFVTKEFIIKSAEIHGIAEPYDNLTRIGRIFENALLHAFDLQDSKKQRITPYPERPDKYFIPDNLRDYKVTTENSTYTFQNAFLEDAKFTTGSEVKLEQTYNPEQIKGFIDYLANARGVIVNGVQTNEKISDYGAATLILTTPADVKISKEIINYAKERNVAVVKRIPIGITSLVAPNGTPDHDAMTKNKMKFTEAFVISPSENKKVGSEYYRAQQEGEAGGSNFESKKVEVDWSKK